MALTASAKANGTDEKNQRTSWTSADVYKLTTRALADAQARGDVKEVAPDAD